MPKASQILLNDGIVGSIFLRYHEEIVDCVRPERSASWYSVQFRSVLKSTILFKIYLFS